MFERFTDPAREVVVAASYEAAALGHAHLGTEHLLLGLLHDRGCEGGRAFASLGVSLDDARARVMTIVERGAMPPGEPVPFSARAKRMLELSVREALQHSHTQIGTGDLALALLRLRDATALRVLGDLGIERDVAQTRVLQMVSQPVETRSRPTVRVVSLAQLPPQAEEVLRRALRIGSAYVARRYVPPRLLRSASTTVRLVRRLGIQTGSLSREQSKLASNAAKPAILDPETEPGSQAASMMPLESAACVSCGKRSPHCGTLYIGAHGVLLCEHCVGAGTTKTHPGEPPAHE